MASAEDLTQFLRLLGTRIGARGVVFLQGVHDDEPLRLAIDDPAVRRAFFVLPQRTLRNFTGQFGRGISSQVVTSERGVEAMLPELEKLSAKTYQTKMLGRGITPGGVIEQQLRFAARQGMARVHLLRVDGQLISFSRGSLPVSHSDPRHDVRGEHVQDEAEQLVTRRAALLSHPKTTRGLVTWLALKAVARGSEAIGAVAGKLADKGAVTKVLGRLVTRKDSD